ncbi:uncharacterized protein HMPREF1541_09554 [Cyphellophora europaea CBS 101466]|uniref:Urea active transporter n=1 Tax=Cyphellophora europaea (strain CBS 101466) TaxID=1220924 RepID=W2SAG1_CYPE1|nr:uncharacterized protein HMPREF1541_09554 [Cyphellophora europaea CBS 101466]ETN45721.1 hypothetical protein HMPREF1541_09554 [Cyphellophora europaea CBS 101466]
MSDSDSGSVLPILPQAAGYGVVVGIGFFFALFMLGVTYLQNRYTKYNSMMSEEFNTASRSIKSGLIACGTVSAWTWAATLLQSSTVTYQYGVSGPFWYAAGATVQIFMFSVLACKVKQNAPRVHTYLEIIQARYGTVAHCIFIFFGLMTNTLVASQLLLGGSAVVTSLTGMNVYAAVWLIPLGVAAYVIIGGLRASFICDYSHTLIVMVIILYFMFEVFTANSLIGSPGKLYDLLVEASRSRPVAGNTDGSYLTLKSNFGLIFGVIQLCSGMGTVFLDQGYWQRAIASRPTAAVPGYIMGGFAWYAIPFGFATTLGLTAVALTDDPSFPTYPNGMSATEVSAGLSSAFGAVAIAGSSGCIALLITLFLAVTSACASELIAVSSILTFDIYKMYVKPDATPQALINVSHIMVAACAAWMSIWACIWNVLGINLGWLFLVMGLLIGGGVMPAAFSITWKGQTKLAVIVAPIVGLCAGLTAWLVTAKVYHGEINITTTGNSYPTLAGNMAGFFTGLIVTVAISLIKPDKERFNWAVTRNINALHLAPGAAASTVGPTDTDAVTGEKTTTPNTNSELPTPGDQKQVPTSNNSDDSVGETQSLDADDLEDLATMEDPKKLRRTYIMALTLAIVLSVSMDFIIPIPMFLSHYIYSKKFFTFYIVIAFFWAFISFFICSILPIWETRHFWRTVPALVRAKNSAKKQGGASRPATAS